VRNDRAGEAFSGEPRMQVVPVSAGGMWERSGRERRV